jgi:hypothetical protein
MHVEEVVVGSGVGILIPNNRFSMGSLALALKILGTAVAFLTRPAAAASARMKRDVKTRWDNFILIYPFSAD